MTATAHGSLTVFSHCIYCGLPVKPGRLVCVGHADLLRLDIEADTARALASATSPEREKV